VIERGNFPVRVHAFEDYDTDIEKRWWMAGKLEMRDVPAGGRRACRATLTKDFDDKMGDRSAEYKAVIFNPVPGPPMGRNTRLSFKYKLHGSDKLRVQLYSLTNNYHRYLSLSGLKTAEWTSATADMTQMRRPDGSGGPLSENERIDDIQFYIEREGDLLIDDIVLYEAAAANEKRPFPKRVIFTAWFDTGKQGQEWSGDYDIVPHEKPRTWKCARSVLNKDGGEPWIRVSLRGQRRLDDTCELFFRYQLTGADGVRVQLRNSKSGWSNDRVQAKLKRNEWSEATLQFRFPKGDSEQMVDEIRFLLPKESQLLIDDVLLYTPA
jgi:hypothetical protein